MSYLFCIVVFLGARTIGGSEGLGGSKAVRVKLHIWDFQLLQESALVPYVQLGVDYAACYYA